MTRYTIFAVVFMLVGGFIGWTIKPEPVQEQIEKPIEEGYEIPATIETNAEIVKDTVIVTNTVVKTDTVNVYIPRESKEMNIIAKHPFYFFREGASFQMDISYRYSDKKFRFENMHFKSPEQKVVYRDKVFKLSSAIGYLVGLNGNDYVLLQPINLRVWKLNLKPTIMPYWDKAKDEYGFAYGGMIEFIW